MKPVCVAQTNQHRMILCLPDGTLQAFFLLGREPNSHDRVVATATSTDDGRTWAEPEVQFAPPMDFGQWLGCMALLDHEGEVHLFFLNDRSSGAATELTGEGDKEKITYNGRRLDIFHCRSSDGRRNWGPLKCIWEGYTGSLNSAIQLRSGRIVLPFSWINGRDWFHRGEGVDAFMFHGLLYSTVVYSDDQGATWRQGTRDLKVWVPYVVHSYGACEPVAIELKDSRVWMVIRTQTGRLYESFSADGVAWSVPVPTRFLSSDSPVGLTRLPDGRLVMIWNACLRYPYANGGRHVIHAVISEDEGRTWRGFREAARDPRRHEPPPTVTGDFGTAYPFPAATRDNHVIYVTGQGKGRIRAMRMDPQWLYETHQRDDFSEGLEEWSVFGTLGVTLDPHPDRPGARALRLTKVRPGAYAAAVWNFPNGQTGTLRLRLRAEPGAGAFRISLADHFSTPFDPEDACHSLFNLALDPGGKLPDGSRLPAGRWETLELAWDTRRRTAEVRVGGTAVATLPLLHETLGACYLRLVSTTPDQDTAGFWLESAEVRIDMP